MNNKLTFENELPWNFAYGNIVEAFGLPGDRYCINFGNSKTTITFVSEQDLLLCLLMYADYFKNCDQKNCNVL